MNDLAQEVSNNISKEIPDFNLLQKQIYNQVGQIMTSHPEDCVVFPTIDPETKKILRLKFSTIGIISQDEQIDIDYIIDFQDGFEEGIFINLSKGGKYKLKLTRGQEGQKYYNIYQDIASGGKNQPFTTESVNKAFPTEGTERVFISDNYAETEVKAENVLPELLKVKKCKLPDTLSYPFPFSINPLTLNKVQDIKDTIMNNRLKLPAKS